MTRNAQGEELAFRILAELDKALCVKLKELKDDLEVLRMHFKGLKRKGTIAGCETWAEFCNKKLHRTDRAVRKLLEEKQAEKSSAVGQEEHTYSAEERETVREDRCRAKADKPERTIEEVDAENLKAATQRTLAYFRRMAAEPEKLRKELTDWFKSVASELGLSVEVEAHGLFDIPHADPRLDGQVVTQ